MQRARRSSSCNSTRRVRHGRGGGLHPGQRSIPGGPRPDAEQFGLASRRAPRPPSGCRRSLVERKAARPAETPSAISNDGRRPGQASHGAKRPGPEEAFLPKSWGRAGAPAPPAGNPRLTRRASGAREIVRALEIVLLSSPSPQIVSPIYAEAGKNMGISTNRSRV